MYVLYNTTLKSTLKLMFQGTWSLYYIVTYRNQNILKSTFCLSKEIRFERHFFLDHIIEEKRGRCEHWRSQVLSIRNIWLWYEDVVVELATLGSLKQNFWGGA